MYPAPLEVICYHCQQAAEKYIKGVMIYFGDDVIKTHDLVKLCDKLMDRVDTSSILPAVAILTTYSVSSRYPCDFTTDNDETKAAINEAKKIKSWARAAIGGKE